MEKVYRLLDWLDMAQAVDWLQDLTETRVDGSALLQLCGAGQCSVYLNCEGRRVELESEDDWPPFYEATGLGMSKVRTPLKLMNNSSFIDLVGPVLVDSTRVKIEQGYFLLACGYDSPQPRFKPSDIEALADKMNGASQHPYAAEIEELRNQLEQDMGREQAALDRYTALAGELENVRHVLERDRAAQQATETRAERAETEAAELRMALDDVDRKPLDPRERATFERLLYVLAQEAGYKLDKPSSDEGLIQQYAASIGATVPSGKGPIAAKLKAAVARRDQDLNE